MYTNDFFIFQAKLRVFDSVWSTSFSLDTVGSSGVVICRDEDHDRTYQVNISKDRETQTIEKSVCLQYSLVCYQYSDT